MVEAFFVWFDFCRGSYWCEVYSRYVGFRLLHFVSSSMMPGFGGMIIGIAHGYSGVDIDAGRWAAGVQFCWGITCFTVMPLLFALPTSFLLFRAIRSPG